MIPGTRDWHRSSNLRRASEYAEDLAVEDSDPTPVDLDARALLEWRGKHLLVVAEQLVTPYR